LKFLTKSRCCQQNPWDYKKWVVATHDDEQKSEATFAK
jgi:hypothetical protein